MKSWIGAGLGMVALFVCIKVPADDSLQVHARETAFAETMAQRDFAAFTGFIAEHAIFFAGNRPLRGRQAVLDAWQPYFTDEEPPFSWGPELIEVLPSGDLALSSGPVLDRDGKCIGTFNSIWRKYGDEWLIVFDRGTSACDFAGAEPE